MSPNDLHEKYLPTQEGLQRNLDIASVEIATLQHDLFLAEQALLAAGFTRCVGPARWKPPLVPSAVFTFEALDHTRQQALALALASVDLCSILLPHQFTPDNAELRQRLLKVLDLSLAVMGQQP